MPIDESELIAERVYTLGPGGEPAIRIQIGRPVEIGPYDYRCGWAFIGEPGGFTAWASGIDSVDALDAALWMVGSRLEILNEQAFDKQLHYAGSMTDRPLGLPVIRGENDLRANYG